MDLFKYHIKIQNIAWDDIAAEIQLKKAKPTEIWNLSQERAGCCLQNSVSFVNKTVTPADEQAAARERSAVTWRISKRKNSQNHWEWNSVCYIRKWKIEFSTQSPTVKRLNKMGLCKSLFRLIAYTSRHASPKLHIICRPIDATKKLKIISIQQSHFTYFTQQKFHQLKIYIFSTLILKSHYTKSQRPMRSILTQNLDYKLWDLEIGNLPESSVTREARSRNHNTNRRSRTCTLT